MEFGISIGANLGDRLARLREARTHVAALAGTRLLASSAVYETEPVNVGPEHRDKAFLNAVLVVDSSLSPDAMGVALRGIEDAMGRVRTADRNSPRPIDLDVLYAGALVSAAPELTLPHPRWALRRFVVQPLADVRPALRLPGVGGTVAETLLALPAKPDVILLTRDW